MNTGITRSFAHKRIYEHPDLKGAGSAQTTQEQPPFSISHGCFNNRDATVLHGPGPSLYLLGHIAPSKPLAEMYWDRLTYLAGHHLPGVLAEILDEHFLEGHRAGERSAQANIRRALGL